MKFSVAPESNSVTIIALDYLFLLSNLTTSYLTTPFHPALPVYPDPDRSTFLASIVHLSASFHVHQSLRLTYLMPRFTYYCMYHMTLDLLPIRLVVDRPLWTSPVYIRRPLLRKLGLKPDLVQS